MTTDLQNQKNTLPQIANCETPADIAALFSQLDNITPETLSRIDMIFNTSRDIEKDREQSAQEQLEIDTLRAKFFISRFPRYVTNGILHKIGLETKPIGDCEEPGWRQHYLALTKGWIPVHTLQDKFQGHSNEAKYVTPQWLEIAIKQLEVQGWQLHIISRIDAEFGIGNTHIVTLCVKDPRI